MGYRMKGFSGFGNSPVKHTTKKTHFHNKDGSIIESGKDKSDYQKWIDYANTLDKIKVDPDKKLPSSSSLEKYHPE